MGNVENRGKWDHPPRKEVKKNALIALYNLVGREILDEVANGQNFSDDLKMEAVSMISEYEDEEND